MKKNDWNNKILLQIGLPAMSTISGAIMLVIPNVMGICIWSPPLDKLKNSVRGVQFCRELVKIYQFHRYFASLKIVFKHLEFKIDELEMR